MNLPYIREYLASNTLAASPERSKKRPLFILHGLFGSGQNWEPQGKVFAVERRVFGIDLPGFDNSKALGLRDFSEELELIHQGILETCKAEGFEPEKKVLVLGHSLGGKMTMALSLLHPELVEACVIVDILPVQYPSYNKPILDLLGQVDPQKWTSLSQAEEALAAFVTDSAQRAFMVWNLKKQSDGSYLWRFDIDGVFKHHDALNSWPKALYPENIAPFKGPALFIQGQKSEYASAEGEERSRALFTKKEVKIVEGAGHWVHVDKKLAFLEAIQDFLIKLNV